MNSMPQRDPPNGVGGKELLAKQSAVNEQGKLRQTPIHDVVFRPTRPVPHEDGHVTEVARAGWAIIGEPMVQFHRATTFPDRARTWVLHQPVPALFFLMIRRPTRSTLFPRPAPPRY